MNDCAMMNDDNDCAIMVTIDILNTVHGHPPCQSAHVHMYIVHLLM